jgi:hypothetical protein
VLNVTKLKLFYENAKKSVEKEGDATPFHRDFNQHDEKVLPDFSDIFNKAHSEGPIIGTIFEATSMTNFNKTPSAEIFFCR